MDQAHKEFIMNLMTNTKDLILAKVRPDGYPQAANWAGDSQQEQVAFLKVCPQVVSILDSAKGFGHTDTIKV